MLEEIETRPLKKQCQTFQAFKVRRQTLKAFYLLIII